MDFSRLDWAFAGTSSTEIKTDPQGRQTVHSKWQHWIDSHSYNPEEEVNDEGDMFPQKDGTTLERGSMVDPATGRMAEYEECWRDVEPVATKDGGKPLCVVIKLEDDANKARGMVVRVGQFCQGFMRVGEKLALERWAWEKGAGWRRQTRMGDMWLPCGVAVDEDWLRKGKSRKDDGVTFGDFLWMVVELEEF